MHISGTIIELIKIQQAYWKAYTLMDSEEGGRDVPPPQKKERKKREREEGISLFASNYHCTCKSVFSLVLSNY